MCFVSAKTLLKAEAYIKATHGIFELAVGPLMIASEHDPRQASCVLMYRCDGTTPVRHLETSSTLPPRSHWRQLKALLIKNPQRRKINISTGFAGQLVGAKQVTNSFWLVGFMQYDLGYVDAETVRLEPIGNPFRSDVLPICPEQTPEKMASPRGFEPLLPP